MASGKKQAATFENPYRVGGGYWAATEATPTLGLNRMHPFDVIVPAIKTAMGERFAAFSAKEGKLSPEQRLLTNVMVLSRPDYGRPLHEVGYEIRWDGRQKLAGMFKAGTGKAAGNTKKGKAAKKAAKAARKPKGERKGGSKGKQASQP